MANNNQCLAITAIVLIILLFIGMLVGFGILGSTSHSHSAHPSSFLMCDSSSNLEELVYIHDRCYNYNDDEVDAVSLPDPGDAVAGRNAGSVSRLLIANLKTDSLTIDLAPGDTSSICSACPIMLAASPDGEGLWLRTTILPAFTDGAGFGQGSGNIALYEVEAETS